MAKQTDKRQSSRRDKNPAEPASARQTLGDTRTGTSPASLKQAVLDNLCYVQGRLPELATKNDWYMAVAYTVRDRMLERFINSLKGLWNPEVKFACYLSAEFLMGPHLGNNLLNLDITEQMRSAVKELGLDMEDLLEQEEEPGLGNGGLGRLAACYMDSLASLRVPAIGYGIRYEFGIFDQEIHDGWQTEKTDKWQNGQVVSHSTTTAAVSRQSAGPSRPPPSSSSAGQRTVSPGACGAANASRHAPKTPARPSRRRPRGG